MNYKMEYNFKLISLCLSCVLTIGAQSSEIHRIKRGSSDTLMAGDLPQSDDNDNYMLKDQPDQNGNQITDNDMPDVPKNNLDDVMGGAVVKRRKRADNFNSRNRRHVNDELQRKGEESEDGTRIKRDSMDDHFLAGFTDNSDENNHGNGPAMLMLVVSNLNNNNDSINDINEEQDPNKYNNEKGKVIADTDSEDTYNEDSDDFEEEEDFDDDLEDSSEDEVEGDEESQQSSDETNEISEDDEQDSTEEKSTENDRQKRETKSDENPETKPVASSDGTSDFHPHSNEGTYSAEKEPVAEYRSKRSYREKQYKLFWDLFFQRNEQSEDW